MSLGLPAMMPRINCSVLNLSCFLTRQSIFRNKKWGRPDITNNFNDTLHSFRSNLSRCRRTPSFLTLSEDELFSEHRRVGYRFVIVLTAPQRPRSGSLDCPCECHLSKVEMTASIMAGRPERCSSCPHHFLMDIPYLDVSGIVACQCDVKPTCWL